MYEISKIDVVGKVKKAEFKSGQKGVTFFANWPGFADLKVGDKVDGDLTRSDYNGKEGWIMNALNKPSSFAGKGNAAISKAMDKKNENINKSMDRKEESIQLSSSQRDAVLMVTTFYPEYANIDGKEDMIKTKIRAWRNWLLDEFANEQPPF